MRDYAITIHKLVLGKGLLEKGLGLAYAAEGISRESFDPAGN